MKQKIFYILMVICCMSLFSAAKQSGKKCDPAACRNRQPTCTKQVLSKTGDKSVYDLSPLTFFINL